ncbi:MAG TPA: hypothetical protein VGG87_05725, partial [Solirubrobacteraceae bacterium]
MSPEVIADRIKLSRGDLSLEVALRPFSFTLRRRGRRLIGGGGLWAVDGTSRDQLLHFTEAVLTHEERAPAERALRAEVLSRDEHRLELELRLHGGRGARVMFGLGAGQRLTMEFECAGSPMRLGVDWARRPGERLVGLGLRHGTTLDQAGRDVQLGADRRYTGPDCPPEMLDVGGIPQGDCAPMPWLNSSRGY